MSWREDPPKHWVKRMRARAQGATCGRLPSLPVNPRARLEEPTHIVSGIGHAEARLIE
jgi:hypothetical protein